MGGGLKTNFNVMPQGQFDLPFGLNGLGCSGVGLGFDLGPGLDNIK